MSESIIFTQEKHIGVVTLDRPAALNALNIEMIDAFYAQLQAWEHDESIHAIVVCAKEGSRAFCAGGDVRWLYDTGLNQDPRQLDFFTHEYQLNQYINDYPKPYVALMDGITMGGGVGISLHGSHPVASENFSFAMPETGIGFFPDIGASYLLSRCPDNFGLYLGLTGNRLNARDALQLGLVKYVIRSSDFSQILTSLLEVDLSFDARLRVDHCLETFAKANLDASITEIYPEVKACFGESSVEGIFDKLEDSTSEWAQKTSRNLANKAPLSLKVTLQQILFAKDKNLVECLAMDLHLVKHFMQDSDFYEGVRALLVDKDKSPKWKPASFEGVSPSMLDRYFG